MSASLAIPREAFESDNSSHRLETIAPKASPNTNGYNHLTDDLGCRGAVSRPGGAELSPTRASQPNSMPPRSLTRGGQIVQPNADTSLELTEHILPKEEVVQDWEGRVILVDQIRGYVVARLTDLTAGDTVEREEAEIPLQEISAADRKILRQGALFRWLIGYKYQGSTQERFNKIVFRRLPTWRRDEIDAADAKARILVEKIEWD